MSDSVFDESDAMNPEQTIADILRITDALKACNSEGHMLTGVRNIGLLFRSLTLDALYIEQAGVERWIERLNHVPAAIGLHPECSNATQRIIDDIRNSIEDALDTHWLENAGTLLVSSADSGINLLGDDDSGILLHDDRDSGIGLGNE